MGLFFTTGGWSGVSAVFVKTGSGAGSGTWTWSGATTANPWDVALDLCDWIVDGARPWTGVITAASPAAVADGNQLAISYSFTGGSFSTVTPSSACQDRLGLVNVSTVQGVPGSHAHDWDVRNDRPWLRAAGGRSRAASWSNGCQVHAHRRPSVEGMLTHAELVEWNAALAEAVDPRTAYVYVEATATWRWLTVGDARPLWQPDLRHAFVGLEVLG